MKLGEEAISEILVADTDTESGAEAIWRKKKKRDNNNSSSKPQQSRHNKHWPAKSSTQLRCCLCSSHGQRMGTVRKCARCDMGMHMVPCFTEYHTKLTL